MTRRIAEWSDLFHRGVASSVSRFVSNFLNNPRIELLQERVVASVDIWFEALLNSLDSGLMFVLPDFDQTGYEPAAERWFERQGCLVHLCMQRLLESEAPIMDAAWRTVKLHIQQFQNTYQIFLFHCATPTTFAEIGTV